MKLDDLKQNWQQSVVEQPTPENFKEVIAMLATETKKIDQEVKRRDILEISIALLLIPVWIYGIINSASTMQTIGCVLAIFTSLYIPYRLINAKQVSAPKNNSMKEFLINERQKVIQQKALLESVFWWYISPITISVMLITLGANVDEAGVPQISGQMMVYYVFVVLLVIGIYFLNRRTAQKRFAPLLENIEQRLAEVDS